MPKDKKIDERYTDWKGRNKTAPIHKWDDFYVKNSKESMVKFLELIVFSKVAEYKVDKGQSYFYRLTGQLEIETKIIPFTVAPDQILRHKPNKICMGYICWCIYM